MNGPARYTWPWDGIRHFMEHARLWPGPLLASAAAVVATVGVAVAAVAACVPGDDVEGAWRWLGWLWAVLAGGLAGVAAWLVVLPPLLAVALDRLASRVLVEAGVEAPGERLGPAIRGALTQVLRTLPLRLLWLVVTVASGPLSPFVGALAMGHLAVLDTLDVALVARGWPVAERLDAVRRLRHELLGAGAVAGLAAAVAAASVVLWPFWLPGVACGAALRAARLERDRG